MSARAIMIVLDSVGIGAADDAADFGDAGSNTLGHIAQSARQGGADQPNGRSGPLQLPNMNRIGLGRALQQNSGIELPGWDVALEGAYGIAQEQSKGKDTPSGHWELAGVPVPFDWGYFPNTVPTFPPELTAQIEAQFGLPGILGNCHASGTEIIARLGEEHVLSGKPICYTSADSVFQIAAHEEAFGLDRLYTLCEGVQELVAPMMIGRVIARPFVGTSAADFIRTANRRDYAIPPPSPTLLQWVVAAGGRTLTVGKIADIYAHQGVTSIRKASGNEALFAATLDAVDEAAGGDLVIANLIDFDQLYGHRRDVPGYAAALEHFDKMLPQLTERLNPDDLVVITADHGCDPTWRGTDHTRERVPVLLHGPNIAAKDCGLRHSFADVAATLAKHLGLATTGPGQPMI